MAFRIVKLALAMVIATALSHEALWAQFFPGIRENPTPGAAGQQTISATGTASVKRKPTRIAHVPGVGCKRKQPG